MDERVKNKLFLGAAILASVAGAWFMFFSEEPPISVSLVSVTRGNVDLTVSNTRAGSVKACQRSRLSLPIGGQIAELLVTEGDYVKKNQILIRLWNKDQQARFSNATAQQAMARLAVEESCGLAELNKRENSRLQSLEKQHLVSVERLDTSNTQVRISAASCRKARASVDSFTANKQLQAAILEKTELTAPFSGVIAEINGEVGEYITPSPSGVATPPAVDLIADDCLYISAPVDEVEASQIKVGMAATVTLDAFRDESFRAEITRIAPYVKELEKQARTVDVELKLLNDDTKKRFLIGYSADIDVIIQQHQNTLRLPTETVIDGNTVLLYQPSTKKLIRRVFTPGISNWRFTEVKTGLSEGDKVLLSLDQEGAIEDAIVVPEND